MTHASVIDFLDEWEVRGPDFAPAAEQLLAGLPHDAPDRAELLYALGEHAAMHDHLATAESWYEQAQRQPGHLTFDPRGGLVWVLLRQGRDAEADALLAELRAASASGDYRGVLHEVVGEALEEAGRTRDALRWFTIGLRDLDPDAEPTSSQWHCLAGRWRVRRALDLPLDRLDEIGEEQRELARLRRDLDL